MKIKTIWLWAVILVLAMMPACAPGGESPTAATPASDQPSAEPAGWRDYELVDVVTGEAFRIADFSGKLILVDVMAVWCGNCLMQQQQIKFALTEVDRDEVVVISLNVEPKETRTIMAEHMKENQIDWYGAIAPPEMIRALTQDFGDSVLFVASTPIIVINRSGEAELVQRGLKTKKVIVELIEES